MSDIAFIRHLAPEFRRMAAHCSATWLPLSLTFDHRAATGGDAARFLQAMIADLHSRH
jgi:pyruvate/2-oxoglutarate dehydrogenase complex dihydrolipoamide acyltransferase (E2) component